MPLTSPFFPSRRCPARSDYYDDSVRPWLPEWMGGYKRMDEEQEEEQGEGAVSHTKAE